MEFDFEAEKNIAAHWLKEVRFFSGEGKQKGKARRRREQT